MAKTFCFCCSLNTGAWIMAFSNLAFTIIFTTGSSIEIFYKHTEEDNLYLILGIIIGIYNLFTGVIMVVAIIKAKEKLVLLYLLLELSNLMIITIFAIFNMFEYRSFMLLGLFILSLILWHGLYCMIGFYGELAEYNSVKSGAIEITCNPHINPLMGLPERAIESTAV